MRVVAVEWEGEDAHLASLRDITDRKRSEAQRAELIREQAARAEAEAAGRRFSFLAQASALLEKGAITQAEFDALKAKILA